MIDKPGSSARSFGLGCVCWWSLTNMCQPCMCNKSSPMTLWVLENNGMIVWWRPIGTWSSRWKPLDSRFPAVALHVLDCSCVIGGLNQPSCFQSVEFETYSHQLAPPYNKLDHRPHPAPLSGYVKPYPPNQPSKAGPTLSPRCQELV